MRLKRTLLLIFLLLAGAIFGALVASSVADIGWLQWLSFSRTIGFSPESPFVLDLSVFRMSFGFSVSLSVAQVLFIGLAIVAYSVILKWKK